MIAFLQGIFNLLSGPLGVAIIGIFLIKGIILAMREHRLSPVENAVLGGGAFYAVAWIMATVMQNVGG